MSQHMYASQNVTQNKQIVSNGNGNLAPSISQFQMPPNITNDMTIPKSTKTSNANLNSITNNNLTSNHKQAFSPNNRPQINPQHQSHPATNMHPHAMHQLGYPKLAHSSGQPTQSAGQSAQHHSAAGSRFAGSVSTQVSANQNFYQNQQHHVQMQQQIRNQQQQHQ